MKLCFLDIETFAVTDLKKTNVYKYCEDPTFEILMCAWNDGGDEDTWVQIGERDIRTRFQEFWDDGYYFVAHNAAFERICFSRVLGLPTGTYLPSDRFIDTQTWAAEIGLPQSLEKLAIALGATEKDSAGTLLINYFSKMNRGKRRFASDSADAADRWAQFIDYCRQDVDTLIDVYHGLKSILRMTEEERRVYAVDQVVNDRGIKIDTAMAAKAVKATEKNTREQKAEVRDITGVDNPGSVQQLLAWINDQLEMRSWLSDLAPEQMPDLKSATVTTYLDCELPDDVRRVLELRQDLALVASKKYTAALSHVGADGRLRGGFRFFGAHTGRWAGRGIQLHNLPRLGFETEQEQDSAIEHLMTTGESSAETLKKLVRPLLQGPFTVVDYSAIEARVIAWLAGEKWALDAFAAGRDIYVETAERMGGLTRSQGKVAVLALGFQGGINSLKVMANGALTIGDRDMTDEEMWDMVNAWRDANPRIVRLWRALDAAAGDGGRVNKLSLFKRGRDLQIRLPSGRSLVYRNMKRENYFDVAKNKPTNGLRFDDPRGFRQGTYGGRLAENVTQAVARDVLAASLARLEDRGYRVVAHVHDEILVEGEHDVDEVSAVMCEPPVWADGLPLSGEGFTSSRYIKG